MIRINKEIEQKRHKLNEFKIKINKSDERHKKVLKIAKQIDCRAKAVQQFSNKYSNFFKKSFAKQLNIH
jgi:hypothetical protein